MNRHSRLGFLLAYLVLLGTALVRAGDTYVNMGSGAFLLGQPEVQLRVYTPDDPATTPEDELFIYHPDGDIIYNSFVLDTGANGLMIAKGRNEVSVLVPMEAKGFVSDEAQYAETGVSGTTMYGVSQAYDMDFAGSDGVPLTLEGVRFMCSADAELGYEGIIGMPAMVGRTVHLDMSVWEAAELGNFMQTLFIPAPPAPTGHRYTIPLRMTHFEQDGQQNPGDPLPTWAPLPFIDARAQRGQADVAGNFLLDTGAQLSMINNRLAVALGLDTNGNGVIDIEEASGTVQISGVGGVRDVPIVSVGGISIPTAEGTDLVWKEFEVIVLDIIPSIDGIIGMDLLHSGWMGRGLGDATARPGAINHIYFDFRDIADDTAEMICDLHPASDVVLNNDAPLVSVVPENGPLSLVEEIPFLVTFGQPVTGFTQEDVELGNGVLLGFEAVAEGLVYRVRVEAEAPPDVRDILDDLLGSSLVVSVSVPDLIAQNAAGSGNARGSGSATCNPGAMTADLATTAPATTDVTPIPFTLDFPGMLLGFTQDAIQVENGTLVNFLSTADPDDPLAGLFSAGFTFDVIPAGNGPVVVTLPTTVSDGFTTLDTYIGDEVTVQFTGFPVAALSSDVVSPSDAASVTVRATFSRQVTGFVQTDVLTANATITGFTELTPGLEYDLVVAPVAPGPVAVVLPAGAGVDAVNGFDSLPATLGFESIQSFSIERVDLDTFRVRLNRPVVDPLSPISYTFDPLLAVLGIEEESPGVYLIHTGAQALATNYSLTITGVTGSDGTVGPKTEEFVAGEFTVTFTDGNGDPVFIGQSPGATDGLGDGFDQEAGGGAGDQPIVRIFNTTGEGDADFLVCDIRLDDGGTERWFIEVVFPVQQRAPWTFTWRLGAVEEGRMILLQELRDDAPYGPPIDMTTVGQVELDADATFEILSGTAEQIPLQFQEGWNLVGTPLVTLMTAEESASDGARGCILSGDTVTRFVQGAYEECPATGPLLAEGGYWMHAAAAGTAEATLGLRDDGTVRLHQGWNLITPTVLCTPSDFPDTLAFWRWGAATLRYTQLIADDDLVPGVGYWVHATETQTLQFPEPVRR